MKSLILGVTMITSILVFGQESREKLTPTQKAERKTEKLTKELNLDKNQSEKILAINLNTAREQEEIKKEMEQLKQKMKTIRTANQKEIESVLTEEQMQKLNTLKENRKAIKGNKKGKHARIQK
ncbi:MAG: hypothetical protein ACPGU5_05345 [Lishizhenia sp.]